MPQHVELSPTAQRKLATQNKQAIITSFIAAFSVIALIGGLLAMLSILTPSQEPEVLISYQASEVDEPEDDNSPTINPIQRSVSTPTSNATAADVLASMSVDTIAIPTPTEDLSFESSDFGANEDDFGDGFAFEEVPELSESQTSFFGASVTGTRICYVIDYSFSMRGQREELMRSELSDSIGKLSNTAQYSLLFWSGPVWQAGDKVHIEMDGSIGQSGYVVAKNDKKRYHWSKETGIQNWEPDGARQTFDWLTATPKNIRKSQRHVKETPLFWGTRWEYPLLCAIEMQPSPDIIVFMTDGGSGPDSLQIAERMSKLANEKSIVINTIALMEPSAKDGMKLLAEKTGGAAIMVIDENQSQDLITGVTTTR